MKNNKDQKPSRSNSRQREDQINIRVTREEKEKIQYNAKSHGLFAGRYLRNLGLNYPVKSVVDQIALTELTKTKADLGRLGGLLKMWLVKDKDKNLRLGLRDHKEIDKIVDNLEALQKELITIARRLL